MPQQQQEKDISALGNMDHLQEAAEDAKRAIQRRMEASKQKAETPADDPKAQEEYTFHIDWKDGRGRRFAGQFTNKIVSIKDRQVIGGLQAQWQGGQPYSSFDPLTQEINFILAHLTVSLVAKPDWAKDLQSIRSLKLIQHIYEEVASHEATFHGHDEDQGGSKASSTGGNSGREAVVGSEVQAS